MLIPGALHLIAGLTAYAAIIGTTLDLSGAADIDGILTVGGQVNAKLRETKLVRRTTDTTDERWFHMIEDGDVGNSTNRKAIIIAPCDGKITRVSLYPSTAGGSTIVRVDKNGVTQSSKTKTTSADTVTHFDFSAASFSKGDLVSVSTDPSTAMGNTSATITIEWDWSTA
jgi:hypothetical protein